MFVPGKPFQPSLMFVRQARGIPWSESAPERCFTQVGSGLAANIALGWKCFPGTNTLAYYEIP